MLFPDLIPALFCCLLVSSNHLLSQKVFRDYFRSPLRLGFGSFSFAVYASSSSLPTMTQDSLHSGIGFPYVTGLSPARFVRLILAHELLHTISLQLKRIHLGRRKYYLALPAASDNSIFTSYLMPNFASNPLA